MVESPHSHRDSHRHNHSHALRRLITAILSLSFLISHSPSLTPPFALLLSFIRYWDSLIIMLFLSNYLLLLLLLLLLFMGWNDGNDDNSADDLASLELTVDATSLSSWSSSSSSLSSSRKTRNPAEASKTQTGFSQIKNKVVSEKHRLLPNLQEDEIPEMDRRKSPDHRQQRYHNVDGKIDQRESTRLQSDLYYFHTQRNSRHRRAYSLDGHFQDEPLQIIPISRTNASRTNASTSAVNSDAYFAHQEATSKHHLTAQLVFPQSEEAIDRIQRSVLPEQKHSSHGHTMSNNKSSKENERRKIKSKHKPNNYLSVPESKSQQGEGSIPTPSPGSDSSVNKKAEAFIKHFREQMRLEQAQSFKRQRNVH